MRECFTITPENRERQRGFAMKEIAISLVVLAALGAVVVFGSNALFGGQKLVQAQQQVSDLASAARLWKKSNNSTGYTGVNMAAISASLGTGTSLDAPWGGTYAIAVNGSDATKFDITLTADSDVSAALAVSAGNGAVGSYAAGTKTITIVSN